MRKTILMIAIGLMVATMMMLTAGGCKKDTDCKLVVTVKHLSDTNRVVPQCSVLVKSMMLKQQNLNTAGQFDYTFKYEAILDIFAANRYKHRSVNNSWLKGESSVRLEPDKQYTKVYLLEQ